MDGIMCVPLSVKGASIVKTLMLRFGFAPDDAPCCG